VVQRQTHGNLQPEIISQFPVDVGVRPVGQCPVGSPRPAVTLPHPQKTTRLFHTSTHIQRSVVCLPMRPNTRIVLTTARCLCQTIPVRACQKPQRASKEEGRTYPASSLVGGSRPNGSPHKEHFHTPVSSVSIAV